MAGDDLILPPVEKFHVACPGDQSAATVPLRERSPRNITQFALTVEIKSGRIINVVHAISRLFFNKAFILGTTIGKAQEKRLLSVFIKVS
jgi:hypothetical protein